MNAVSLYSSAKPSPEQIAARARLSEIDQSIKWPALLFICASAFWLLVGTAFALVASFKLHNREFLEELPFLHFANARSAHLNAMAFGFLNNAIFAILTWLMARLCRIEVRYPQLILVAGVFWNIGILVGVGGILAGYSTSVEWLEMPQWVAPLLAVSYALVGVWSVVMFRYRQTEHVYVSQWYILAAVFWFPWLYTAAQLMIIWSPATGVVQSLANWWFAHNALGLWFTPIGLAAAYYFIPKVLGRPIYSYHLSLLGFWTLAIFYNWAGVHHLIGGPVPAWVITAGVVASVMMVVPVLVTAINHHLTVVGQQRAVLASPTLRFVVFGAISYTLTSLIGSFMAVREVNQITHFTHFTVGHAHHGAYGFVAMVMFGSIYYILPRLLFREWPSSILIKVHFWGSAIGITIMLVALHVGGWIQGIQLHRPDADGDVVPFMQVMSNTIPYLISRSVSGTILTVAHIAFAINLVWMVFGRTRHTDEHGQPTLFFAPDRKTTAEGQA